jgi:hypothetical protein
MYEMKHVEAVVEETLHVCRYEERGEKKEKGKKEKKMKRRC